MQGFLNLGCNGHVQVEAESLPDSSLQFVRLLPVLRIGKRRTNCKESLRLPQATVLKDHHARLNATIAPTVLKEALNYTEKSIYKLFQVWYHLACPGM